MALLDFAQPFPGCRLRVSLPGVGAKRAYPGLCFFPIFPSSCEEELTGRIRKIGKKGKRSGPLPLFHVEPRAASELLAEQGQHRSQPLHQGVELLRS